MSENEKMRVVECNPFGCGHVFKVIESNVKSVDKGGEDGGCFCYMYKKVPCPNCGKKHYSLWDYDLSKAASIISEFKANSPISCPHCSSTQLHTSDKGYSVAKGLAGSVVAGGIGLLAGFHGSKRVMITCLECSHKWEVGR